MGVGVVASAAAAPPAAAAASVAFCHITRVCPPPTCATVVYNTASPPEPDESILGSIHTTRPSPAPAARAPPSPRHATDVASAPRAMEATIADDLGALASMR